MLLMQNGDLEYEAVVCYSSLSVERGSIGISIARCGVPLIQLEQCFKTNKHLVQ